MGNRSTGKFESQDSSRYGVEFAGHDVAMIGRERALEPFRRMSSFVDPAEKDIVNDLMTIRMEKMDLDVHYSLQGILRRWLIVHVPPAAVLMALLAVHILAWALY